ncbi:MAG: type II toxin-antitoxin system VapC family toxin [Myxococcaceae bacterium]|nr:type II toxin-antitoxin system VapC family toxin [Myxococcaceae bacterium]
MFLLDTDVCSAIVGGDGALADRLMSRPTSQVATCSVVRAELDSGAWGTADPFGMLAKFDRLLAPFVSLPFDDSSAATYGRVSADLRRAGREIGVADTMIAAIALEHDLTVVTRNVRHFSRIKGLKVARW